MSRIKFVRVSVRYGSREIDVVYDSNRLRTYDADTDHIPDTVVRFMVMAKKREGVDSLWGKETIYEEV